MIQETTVTLRKQTPTAPNEWLYQSTFEGEIEVRNFVKSVYLGNNAEPWAECTEEEHQEHLAHNEQVRLEMERSMEEQQ